MTLDELKSNWKKENAGGSYDEATMKKAVRKHTGMSFQYFWASFVLQLMVYAMLSNVIVKHWYDPMITLPALAGVALYIPFTVVMMKKFKVDNNQASMSNYIQRRSELLESFYRFKKRYELFLIPVVTFIGTFLVFELYVPGGIWAYPKGAAITFFLSLAGCIIAIQRENKRNFEEPLMRLKMILYELNGDR